MLETLVEDTCYVLPSLRKKLSKESSKNALKEARGHIKGPRNYPFNDVAGMCLGVPEN